VRDVRGLGLGQDAEAGSGSFFSDSRPVAGERAESMTMKTSRRTQQPERMLPICDVADLLSVHNRTIQREIQRGNLLPVVEVSGEIRIPLSTIRTYIQQRTIRPAA
jgi:hypothetical protein